MKSLLLILVASAIAQPLFAETSHELNFEGRIHCYNEASRAAIYLGEYNPSEQRTATYTSSRTRPIKCKTEAHAITCIQPNDDIFKISSDNFIKEIQHDLGEQSEYLFTHSDDYGNSSWRCSQR